MFSYACLYQKLLLDTKSQRSMILIYHWQKNDSTISPNKESLCKLTKIAETVERLEIAIIHYNLHQNHKRATSYHDCIIKRERESKNKGINENRI